MDSHIRGMSALELGKHIKDGEISCRQAVSAYLDAIKQKEGKLNAFITVSEKQALEHADSVQKHIIDGDLDNSPFIGVPIAIKDNMCINGVRTTAGSGILDNFIPRYTSVAVYRAFNAGMISIGKNNMDEFAMGGSTETSHYGVTGNPWNNKKVPGGSSGGSASAVASGMAPLSLGSDTGGSVRQPAAFTGLTGIKPTYGSVSRYGLLAYASSLDQISPIAHDIKDAACLLSCISGKDKRDSTSNLGERFDFSGSFADEGDPAASVRGVKIGIPVNYYGKGLDPEIKSKIYDAAKLLENNGAIIEEFTMPAVDYAVPAYYVIACAEASSNLSRYDGIKYGIRSKKAENIVDTYYKSRSEGFGSEVKRRIMLGSFVLSSGYFDAYYKKALKVRGLIKNEFNKAFNKYDMILSPVSPTAAYDIGGQISDPIAMYMADIYTVSVNLAGLPAVSIPCGFTPDGLPIGMQLIGDSMQESKLIKIASAYQIFTDYHKKRPDIFYNDSDGGFDDIEALNSEGKWQ